MCYDNCHHPGLLGDMRGCFFQRRTRVTDTTLHPATKGNHVNKACEDSVCDLRFFSPLAAVPLLLQRW